MFTKTERTLFNMKNQKKVCTCQHDNVKRPEQKRSKAEVMKRLETGLCTSEGMTFRQAPMRKMALVKKAERQHKKEMRFAEEDEQISLQRFIRRNQIMSRKAHTGGKKFRDNFL